MGRQQRTQRKHHYCGKGAMVTVEQVEIYDQNGKMLGVLDNADGIGYELKHNDLWTGSFLSLIHI